MMKTGQLFLLPAPLGSDSVTKQIPDFNKQIIAEINYFIVENERIARRYLKQLNPDLNIENLKFAELNEHTKDHELMDIFQPVLNGKNAGLVSEAGLPCVADPGNNLVFMAHQLGIRVVPLVGPSSIMLALMASGFNGQNFTFHGYLPIDKRQREQKLKELERNAWKNDQTQIFIETPYRNMQMLESVVHACRSDSRLCIAANLLSSNEIIVNKTIKDWKSSKHNFNKQLAIFLMYK